MPSAVVGFSLTDQRHYEAMQAWTAHTDIDAQFQALPATTLAGEREARDWFRTQLQASRTYILLIGSDTRYRHPGVAWEAEVALEMGCRLIGANLDQWRFMNPLTCPAALQGVDALFVPFSRRIIAYTLERFIPPSPPQRDDRRWDDRIYQNLGFVLDGPTACLSPPAP